MGWIAVATSKSRIALAIAVCWTGLFAGCSGAGGSSLGSPEGSPSDGGQDGSGQDATMSCGGAGQACCSGTACNSGLSCSAGTCSGATPSDATVDSMADVAMDVVSDAGAADAGRDSGAGIQDASADSPTDAADAGCSPGAVGCNGQQPEICTNLGNWQNIGSACSGATPACVDGACLACAPAVVGCNGQQPEVCSDAGVWRNVGGPCSGADPACLSGTCVACEPGSVQCFSSSVAQACSDAGAWQSTSCGPPTPVCLQGICGDCPWTITDAGTCTSCGVPGNCVVTAPIPASSDNLTTATADACQNPSSGQCVLDIDLGNAVTGSFSGGTETLTVPMLAADIPVNVIIFGIPSCTVDIGVGEGGCNGNTPSVFYTPVPVQVTFTAVDGGGADGGAPLLGCDDDTAMTVAVTIDPSLIQICGGLCASISNALKSDIAMHVAAAAQSEIVSAINNRVCLH